MGNGVGDSKMRDVSRLSLKRKKADVVVSEEDPRNSMGGMQVKGNAVCYMKHKTLRWHRPPPPKRDTG